MTGDSIAVRRRKTLTGKSQGRAVVGDSKSAFFSANESANGAIKTASYTVLLIYDARDVSELVRITSSHRFCDLTTAALDQRQNGLDHARFPAASITVTRNQSLFLNRSSDTRVRVIE